MLSMLLNPRVKSWTSYLLCNDYSPLWNTSSPWLPGCHTFPLGWSFPLSLLVSPHCHKRHGRVPSTSFLSTPIPLVLTTIYMLMIPKLTFLVTTSPLSPDSYNNFFYNRNGIKMTLKCEHLSSNMLKELIGLPLSDWSESFTESATCPPQQVSRQGGDLSQALGHSRRKKKSFKQASSECSILGRLKPPLFPRPLLSWYINIDLLLFGELLSL